MSYHRRMITIHGISVLRKGAVTPSFVDSNFKYSSLITITNSSPKPAYITVVSLLLPDDWIVPAVSSPTLLPANSQVSLPFSVNLPDQGERTSRIAVILHHDSKATANYFLSPSIPVEFNTNGFEPLNNLGQNELGSREVHTWLIFKIIFTKYQLKAW